MQRLSVAFLMLFVFASSLGVVYVRHQHRIQYMHYSDSVLERDSLNIEWNQLLTESSTWSFPHRVEKDATKSLSMIVPKIDNIVGLDNLELHLGIDDQNGDISDSLSKSSAH